MINNLTQEELTRAFECADEQTANPSSPEARLLAAAFLQTRQILIDVMLEIFKKMSPIEMADFIKTLGARR